MQLHRFKPQFESAGFQIILVGLGNPDEAEAFRKQFSPSLPIICDPEKILYHAYGLKKVSVAALASPSLWLNGLKTLAKGHMPGISKDNVMQMSGVFLIDTAGDIRYAYYSKDPSDNPSVDSLLALKKDGLK